MPGKFQMVLILIALVGGVWGASMVDWTRNVPMYPPDHPLVTGMVAAAPAPGGPGEIPPAGENPPPEDNTPPDMGGGVPPPPDDDGGTEIRLTDPELQMVNAQHAIPVEDPGTDRFVLIRIKKDGELHWGGLPTGGYDMVDKLLRKNASRDGFEVVIAADRYCPWQYVYWTIQLCQEAGLAEIGLGVTTTSDPQKTLLSKLRLFLPQKELELPELPELVVTINRKEGGGVNYTVFETVANNLEELSNLVSGYNNDYAEELGASYARDVNKTPWRLDTSPRLLTGQVLVTLDAIRCTAIYTIRLGGEIGPRPR